VSTQLAEVIDIRRNRQVRRLLPLGELRELLGGSERWWRYRIAEDGFPAHKWGSRLRFDPVEVERWLKERYGA
jgi:predicted DNA-binding transcriptional regulator AlpA